MKTITLYNPVGEIELCEIAKKEFKLFPTLLDLPLTLYASIKEAKEIAEKLYTKDEIKNFLGFVLEVDITEEDFFKLSVQNSNNEDNWKYTVTLENLEFFNAIITDKIRIVDVFIGTNFKKNKNDLVEDYLYFEEEFHQMRIDIFLSSTNREIIPLDFFDCSLDNEGVELDKNEILHSQEIMMQKVKNINTIDEAIDYLIEKEFTEEQLNSIKAKTPFAQIYESSDHFGINMYYRNLFFYSNNNQKFKESVQAYGNISFSRGGELGEGYIADLLWRKLNYCQIENLMFLDEIQKIENEIQTFYDDYYKEKGKVRGEIDPFDALNDEFFKGLNEMYDKKNLGSLHGRKMLLTFNFSEEEIKKYLELEIKIKENSQNKMDYIYEQKAILAKVEPQNYDTFKKLKNNLLKIEEVTNKLQQCQV
ncbi:conserved hypothetical protein [Flavobacterium sp. 9AF]|uniref:hypothetical protein n=1 Tax=Flavobacterium sp. 9AF TaxID=2653142 RepID=UPI0012F26876|nr:hypothetical protein [Flavobacterium sp. 9AF]VXB80417.1 conserved hypothetical protein [Flavobacterium sp. 9AF]